MSKLDNPAWHALHEQHRAFALGNDQLKLYDPQYAPFGGIYADADADPALLEKYLPAGEFYFIIGSEPVLPPGFILEKELICLQMICPEMIPADIGEPIISLTAEAHEQDLFDLVNLVQPGYFRSKTRLMGDYFGIYNNGRLVAVTGERMRMSDFTEISAVVTHPDFTGRGYAGQLVAHTVNKNLAAGLATFLHVTEDNTPAIRLYEKLGFGTRRKISFWRIRRSG